MDKNDQYTNTLIDKFLRGKATEKEVDDLNSLYHSVDDSEVDLSEFSHTDLMERKQLMFSDLQKNIADSNTTSKRTHHLSVIWKVAAAIVVVAGLSFYYISQKPAGYEVATVTKMTEKGQKQTLTLSDGSIVKLNAGSSVTYPEKFDADSREVELIGEAFFEVAKDTKRPFRVVAGNLATTALGTSFNINAYPERGKIDVSLATGKVSVELLDGLKQGANSLILNPGERASYSTNEELVKKSTFDLEEVIAWKDGVIYFKNADEKAIVEKLERWYGVEIDVENQAQKNIDVTTKFENASLQNVLQSLGYTLGFEFEINEDQIRIIYTLK